MNIFIMEDGKMLNSPKNFIIIKKEKVFHSKNSKLTIKRLSNFNFQNVTL